MPKLSQYRKIKAVIDNRYSLADSLAMAAANRRAVAQAAAEKAKLELILSKLEIAEALAEVAKYR
jgi:hypothetical protein